jgi:hypothetical protein
MDGPVNPLIIEHKAEITAMAHCLIKAGWLKCFFWGEGDKEIVPELTERGKINFAKLDSFLKQNRSDSLAGLDLSKITILKELGTETLKREDLQALSFLVICFASSGQLRHSAS